MKRINMSLIAEQLTAAGIPTLIDSTGGGVMCLFVGEPTDGVYPAQAGPGTTEEDGVFGMAGDFYAGRDEMGPDSAENTHFPDDATEADVVAYIRSLL